MKCDSRPLAFDSSGSWYPTTVYEFDAFKRPLAAKLRPFQKPLRLTFCSSGGISPNVKSLYVSAGRARYGMA